MKIHAALITVLTLFLGLNMTAHATTTEVRLKVLPMDCVFNFIDDGGSGIIVYITPAECGVDTPLPNPNPATPLVPTNNVKNYLRLRGLDFTNDEIVSSELHSQDESSPSSIRFTIDNHAPKSLEKNNSITFPLLEIAGTVSLLLVVAYVTRGILSYNKN